jgi:hypothetical protein
MARLPNPAAAAYVAAAPAAMLRSVVTGDAPEAAAAAGAPGRDVKTVPACAMSIVAMCVLPKTVLPRATELWAEFEPRAPKLLEPPPAL